MLPVIVVSKQSGVVKAVGHEDQRKLHRTPRSIAAVQPLCAGATIDYTLTVKLLQAFIRRVTPGLIRFVRQDVMASVPAGISKVEARVVIQTLQVA